MDGFKLNIEDLHDWSLSKLVKEVKEGTVRIPDFQRKFEWNGSKVALYLDSILKGYPRGQLMLAKSNKKWRESTNVSGINPKNKIKEFSTNEVYYCLDGQQRITTLVNSFSDKKVGDVRFDKVFINIGRYDDQIIVYKVKEDENENMIPLYKVLNYKILELTKYLSDIGVSEERYDDIIEIRNQILEQRMNISVSNAINDDVSVATDIFIRVNTGGKGLRFFDIISVIWYDESRDFYFKDKVSELIEDIEKNYKIKLTNDNILNLLFVIFDKDNINQLSNVKTEEIESKWDKIKLSIRQSVQLLITEYGASSKQYMNHYNIIFILLTVFFYKNKNKMPDVASIDELRKMFISVIFSNDFTMSTNKAIKRYSNQNVENIINKKLNTYNNDEILYNLRECLNNGDFKRVSSLNVMNKKILSLYAMINPKSFKTGQKVMSIPNKTSQTNVHKHHIIPESRDLKSNNIFNIALLDGQSNQHFGNKMPKEYLKTLKSSDWYDSVIKSHFLNNVCIHYLESGDISKFIEERKSIIKNYVSDILNSKSWEDK